MFSPDEVYKISDFITLCKKTLSDNIPSCYLQGEVSNLSTPSSGHIYFSLKDDKSQIRCALFRLSRPSLSFELKNGQFILVRAKPTIYDSRGDFQIIIDQIEPLGIGRLQQAFEQLKKRLNKEGLFDQKRKKPLPAIINTIGVISSDSGAVIEDIIKVLRRRQPDVKILLFSTSTQGQTCPLQVIKACQYADKSVCDVLIIARGGGSLEDLWCFNEEAVARAIFALKTPVVSAIGHQTDTTIADFVADARAPTPSAAAEMVSADRAQQRHILRLLSQKLLTNINWQLTQHKSNLNQIIKRLKTPLAYINELNLKLDYLATKLHHNTQQIISNYKIINNKWHKLLQQQSPAIKIATQKQYFTNQKQRLNQQIDHYINRQKQQLSNQIDSLNHLNPLHILKRGFSISLDNKQGVISSVKHLRNGQKISIRLADGTLFTKILNIQ